MYTLFAFVVSPFPLPRHVLGVINPDVDELQHEYCERYNAVPQTPLITEHLLNPVTDDAATMLF